MGFFDLFRLIMADIILLTGLLGRSDSVDALSSFVSSIVVSLRAFAFRVFRLLYQHHQIVRAMLPAKATATAIPAICGVFRPVLPGGGAT
jgi:fumarate reductase subunit D